MAFKDVKRDRSQAKLQDRPLFSGKVYQQPLVTATDSDEVTITAVWFENGARTRPHIHDNDQLLEVVEGTCVVADEHSLKHLAEGEIAFVKAGEWHWHGADKGTDACHLSIRKNGPTKDDVPERDWGQWQER
ncbi:MAG: cupin domain-containing protein [Chloroflexi bacterium]|nr:cupin domain-containing protein [Chloroflexota bacterium]